MKIYKLRRELWVPHDLDTVFDFFSKAENLEKLTPPWLRFRIVTPLPVEMKPGALIAYSLRVRGFPVRWITEIETWFPPFEFTDVQLQGPYKLWHHTHRFSEARHGGTNIVDIVRYALPFGLLGRLVNRLQVGGDIEAIFDYRAQQVTTLLPLVSQGVR